MTLGKLESSGDVESVYSVRSSGSGMNVPAKLRSTLERLCTCEFITAAVSAGIFIVSGIWLACVLALPTGDSQPMIAIMLIFGSSLLSTAFACARYSNSYSSYADDLHRRQTELKMGRDG